MPLDAKSFEKVSLIVSASDLPKLSTFGGHVNPFAVLFQNDMLKKSLVPIGFTNVLQDNCNPQWTSVFTVDYHFEVIQEFTIKIFHQIGNHPLGELSKHVLAGEFRFLISELMCSSSQLIIANFDTSCSSVGESSAKIAIRGEILHNTRDNFIVTFLANRLVARNGFFSTPSPLLRISRMNEDGIWTPVWESGKVENSVSPRWTQAKIPMMILCNSDVDRPLLIEVLDHDKKGKHSPMGQVQTSVSDLIRNINKSMNIVEPKKQKNKGYVNSGTLQVTFATIEENPTFGNFVAGGCEISLVVAIDFTGSNGDQLCADSLHYIHPSPDKLNPYQLAITAVGNVLKPYDSDNLYPVYGFGAKLKQSDGTFSPTQHCFNVYSGGLEVKGVEGILQAYKECSQSVMLSGPTLFAPLINSTAEIARNFRCSQEHQKYLILLIITDGVVNDMDLTKKALINASNEPLSVVIVGVGNADFSLMTELDSDNELLTHEGFTATRDIVQFVALNEQILKGQSSLAEQVLAEIPTQLLQYMSHNNIRPNKTHSAGIKEK